jgi:hydrogenase nickel incorporation protein HypB
MTPETRLTVVRRNILNVNDVKARALRARFREAGLFVVSVVSSPGSGKTALFERVLADLHRRYRVAALVGDLATEHDATRLARSGADVRQITTGTTCHLEAAMVDKALAGWDLGALDFLLVENVGNLVCPSSYDLGEGLRVVLVSVTEGEDKPRKYPTIFNSADLAVVTKMDLAKAVDFDADALHASVHAVRPGMPVLEVSAKSGQGVDELVVFLESRRRDRAAAPPPSSRSARARMAAPIALVSRSRG